MPFVMKPHETPTRRQDSYQSLLMRVLDANERFRQAGTCLESDRDWLWLIMDIREHLSRPIGGRP